MSDSGLYDDEYESSDDLDREESSVTNIIMNFNKNPKNYMINEYEHDESSESDK